MMSNDPHRAWADGYRACLSDMQSSKGEKRENICIERYTSPGQISVGDLLLIGDGKTVYSARCQQICRESEDPEIVFNRKKNHYFITSMYLAGESWAKDVRIVRRPEPQILETLKIVARVISDADSPITDTLWASDYETLLDAVMDAIASAEPPEENQ